MACLVLAAAFTVACAGGGGTAARPAAEPEPSVPAPDGTGAQDPITAARCKELGGSVVGDIGDGAIHRPDYRCPGGEPPLGAIAPEAGEPQAVEGAVCCR
jgi:hypothetical protein